MTATATADRASIASQVKALPSNVGADPATASSIVVTTATDVASLGLLLGLAALFIA